MGSCSHKHKVSYTMDLSETCQQGELGHLAPHHVYGSAHNSLRLESNIFSADYFIIFIMNVYIHSGRVLQGSQGSCKWQGSTLWGNMPVALPLCHGRHHSHRLLMQWSAMRVILMSWFIRATMHAGLWCHRMFFFSFWLFLSCYLSISPYYNLLYHFLLIMAACLLNLLLVTHFGHLVHVYRV